MVTIPPLSLPHLHIEQFYLIICYIASDKDNKGDEGQLQQEKRRLLQLMETRLSLSPKRVRSRGTPIYICHSCHSPHLFNSN